MPFLYDAVASLYSDELARRSTVTMPTGTAIDTYGVDRLTDDNPAHLFRTTSTTVRLVFAHPERTVLALLALIHATTEADDDVRLQANDIDDWSAPDFDVVFPQAGWLGSGSGRWPVNPRIFPSALEGYDQYGYNFHSLIFGRDTPLAQNLELGNIRMHPTFQFWALDRAAKESWEKRRIQHETSFGVRTKYLRRADTQSFAIGMSGLDESASERATLKAQWADVEGDGQPFLFVPDASVNECYLTCWDMTVQEFDRQTRSQAGFSGRLREVGRGLRPGI